MKQVEILPGFQNGYITVIKELEKKVFPSGQKKRNFLCKCGLCQRDIEITITGIKKTESCVNCSRIQWGKNRKTHGKTGTKIYYTYRSMLNRCYDPKNQDYHNYGGKGIKVCDRWLGENGMQNFLEDMGEKPDSRYSIDRYPDKNGNYSPDNCRWALPKEQSQNLSTNVLLSLNGKTLCLAEWARKLNCNPQTLADRKAKGWTDEKVLTVPIRRH
jgi:hypothetical protein